MIYFFSIFVLLFASVRYLKKVMYMCPPFTPVWGGVGQLVVVVGAGGSGGDQLGSRYEQGVGERGGGVMVTSEQTGQE